MKTTFTYAARDFQKLLLSFGILLLSSLLTSGQSLHMVEVRDTEFDPAALEIAVGDTVEWTNVFGTHNVNGTQGTFPSNPESFGNEVGEDWTYRHVFTAAGEYNYRCDPHAAVGMTGTITVTDENDGGDGYMLTVDFTEMTPHVGQDFYLAVIDSISGMETGRVHITAETDFSVEVPGIEEERVYHVDFWADHNGNGMYDAPPTDHAWRMRLTDVVGDTTLNFIHNTDFTDIMWNYLLTINFTGMDPHVGQDIHLAVIENSTDSILRRVYTTGEVEFTIEVPGIETGNEYHIDFWADHNGNGRYDAPPTDHAWRLELIETDGDTTMLFEHNTNFTDIMWQNFVTVQFRGMTPHVGQDFYLAVIDKPSGLEVGRVHTIAEVDYNLKVPGIEPGGSYYVDFWADHNGNGGYDAPPTDHAWRIELNDVPGDTTLTFEHNTNFTDIMWKNMLTVEFTGMTPHVGQDFYLAVTDTATGKEINRVHIIAETDFTINVTGLETAHSYNIDFWADHNGNGMYDTPPADHAWRMKIDSIYSDSTLTFMHNTDFTDIMWKNRLTVEFRGMTPHIGQTFTLYVVNTEDNMYLDTIAIDEVPEPDFNLHSYVIEQGGSYHIDFWADHNNNDEYDAPPTDHAWRLNLEEVSGDTTLIFVHNTNFTDIFSVTSVDMPQDMLFRMYPNPATDKVWIETGEVNLRDYKVSVYDISGRLKKVENSMLNNRIEMNTRNLTKGLYFVRLRSSSSNHTMKLIVK